MTYLKAILLGLVQGIAEFLPISSSGHLAIARNLLNMEGAGNFFSKAKAPQLHLPADVHEQPPLQEEGGHHQLQ